MKKNQKVPNGKSSTKRTYKPTTLITGQLIRIGVIQLLDPSTFEEVFEITPKQIYLDNALIKLTQYSDDQLFERWIMISYIEQNKSAEIYMIQMYALEDIAWGLYIVEYCKDHPENWTSTVDGFATKKKNWFQWY